MEKTWVERMRSTPEGERRFQQERLILGVAELICDVMKERDVSKAELARRLGTSKANVTQMLSGFRNLTLRSLSDVFLSLGKRLELKAVAADMPLAPAEGERVTTVPWSAVHQKRDRRPSPPRRQHQTSLRT